MTPEELRAARLAEAIRRAKEPGTKLGLSHLADLYETNWTPSDADHDLLAAISYAKNAIGDDSSYTNLVVKNAYLAGCTRGREGATNVIKLTPAEVQSGHDRVRWAQALIEQLPGDHDGRNSWLLNYGVGAEAVAAAKRWVSNNPTSDIPAHIRAALASAKRGG